MGLLVAECWQSQHSESVMIINLKHYLQYTFQWYTVCKMCGNMVDMVLNLWANAISSMF